MSSPEAGKKRKRTGRERQKKKDAVVDTEVHHEAETNGSLKTDQQSLQSGAEEDHQLIADRIPRALKVLHPVFKQARTFETQRLVKKIRFLRTKSETGEEVNDLEAQLRTVSHIKLDDSIKEHLLLKLQKHHTFKNQSLPSAISQNLLVEVPIAESSIHPALAEKAQNRLYSNRMIADSVKSTISWLAGEDGARLPRPGPKASAKSRQNGVNPVAVRSAIDANVRGLHVQEAEAQGSDDEEEDAQGWESGSVSANEIPFSGHVGVANSDDLSDEDDVPIGSEEESSMHDSKRHGSTTGNHPVHAKPDKKLKTAPPVTSSTFLPTLSSGFIMGDSDSDPDLDPDIDGSGMIGNTAVRKNRRGQRARQAIWEKKFGRNAKHVVKARVEESQGPKLPASHVGRTWGGRNESTNGGESGGGPPMRGRPFGQQNRANGTPTNPTDTETKTSVVHPSWEAAKMRKQREAGGVASHPQGQKIVFD